MKNMKLIMESWRKFSIQEKLKSNFSAREFQRLINKNQYLKGTKAEGNLIAGGNYVLLFSEQSAKHIANRHQDGSKPGSLFNGEINLREIAEYILKMKPTEQSGGRVKWLDINIGKPVGAMGVAKSTPEEVAKMQDHQMSDGRNEMVKIKAGKREATNIINLITAELGDLSDGRKALSLLTMFPGGNEVDGTTIPADRSKFAEAGLYFVVDNGSPLLQSSEKTVTKETLRRMIRELLKENNFKLKYKMEQIYNNLFNNVDGFTDNLEPDMCDWIDSIEDYIKYAKEQLPDEQDKVDAAVLAAHKADDLQSRDHEDKEGSEFGF